MSDTITAKNSDAKFKSHPEGQYIGVCVDTIDLGNRVEEFAGKAKKLSPKCALVFRTGERNEQTGDYIDIAREFTVSMGDLANLRKFLEQWRGKPYAAEQIAVGVPLHKLTGNPGLLSVAHKTSGKGRTYANITACVGVPKQMMKGVPVYTDYVRDPYWQEKKDAYAAEVRVFRSESAPPSNDDFDDSREYDGSDDDEPNF